MTPEQLREAIGDPETDIRTATGVHLDALCGIAVRPAGVTDQQVRECSERRRWRALHQWPQWPLPRPEHGIGSLEWFERESAPLPGIEQVRLEDDPLYQRHTVDIQQPPPQHVEDDSLAVERGEWWANVVWMVLGVAFVAYVAIRIWAGGGQ